MSIATPMNSHAPSASARRRIALVHDWLCGYRGGEAVLDRIAQIVSAEHECAGVWTMVDDGRPLTPTIDSLPKHTSFLQRIPCGPRKLRRWLLPLYPRAVDSLSRSLAREHAQRPIDLVVSTSSAAVKGIQPPSGPNGQVPHVCYCHSPARYLWSQQTEYSSGLRGLGLSLFASRLRAWDARTAANVTQFAANSSHTRDEVRRCYAREAIVVFPAARTQYFTPDSAVKRDEFWLFVGALEPYKRADLAIEAANRLKHPLVIAGSGSSRASLERLAGPTVRFEGRVSDDQLRSLYRRARMLLFPQVEDFGIVAVEAQACGLPVIAQARGGALDTVIDGTTGVLFDSPTPDALLDAIKRFNTSTRTPHEWEHDCRVNAERFAESAFDDAIRAWITPILNASTTNAAR